MKRQLKPYTVNLYQDTVEQLKRNNIEYGPYIRDLLDNNVETLEMKREKAEKLQAELNQLNALIQMEEDRKEKIFDNLNERHIVLLYDLTNGLSKRNFYPRKRRYMYIFDIDLTDKEFRMLLDESESKIKDIPTEQIEQIRESFIQDNTNAIRRYNNGELIK